MHNVCICEAGMLFRLLRWADNPTAFCLMNAALNLAPNVLAVAAATVGSYAAQATGLGVKAFIVIFIYIYMYSYIHICM